MRPTGEAEEHALGREQRGCVAAGFRGGPGGNGQCGEWQAKQKHSVEVERVVASTVMGAQVRDDSDLTQPAAVGGQKEVDR